MCTSTSVTLHKYESVTFRDNGSVIRTGVHPVIGKSALETGMTVLHAGGFGASVYYVSDGLHGVGDSVLNSIIDWLVVSVWHYGRPYTIRFNRGVVSGTLNVEDDTVEVTQVS